LQFRRGAESAEPQSGIEDHLRPFLRLGCFHAHEDPHVIVGRLEQSQAAVFGGSRNIIEIREKPPEQGVAGLLRLRVL
jgi:hypothetical protein